jgi:hypothetical protein
MLGWFDIKRAAIAMNVDRKSKKDDETIHQMLDKVRRMIAQSGYTLTRCGLTQSDSSVFEFRTSDGLLLEYDYRSDTWKP